MFDITLRLRFYGWLFWLFYPVEWAFVFSVRLLFLLTILSALGWVEKEGWYSVFCLVIITLIFFSSRKKTASKEKPGSWFYSYLFFSMYILVLCSATDAVLLINGLTLFTGFSLAPSSFLTSLHHPPPLNLFPRDAFFLSPPPIFPPPWSHRIVLSRN